MDKPQSPFIGTELEDFVLELGETVTKHCISVDAIQRCLSLMGSLGDRGHNAEQVLASKLNDIVEGNEGSTITQCFKCEKILKVLHEDTSQFDYAVEFIGRGAFGSRYDMEKFAIQICDDCLVNVPHEEILQPHQVRKFTCNHCDKVLAEFQTLYNQSFCDDDCRVGYGEKLRAMLKEQFENEQGRDELG